MALETYLGVANLGTAIGGTDPAVLVGARENDGTRGSLRLKDTTHELLVNDASVAAALTTLLTGLALAAGSNEIGRTNIKHFNITASGSGILTRPANTTTYASGDSVSDNATAGSVSALPVTISDTNDNPVDIVEIMLDSSDTGFGGSTLRVHLFASDPTASSGVQAGDNAVYSQKRADWIGSFSGVMMGFFDGCRGVLTPDGPTVKIARVESGGMRLWWQLQILNAATPAINSSVFTPIFKGYQGRP